MGDGNPGTKDRERAPRSGAAREWDEIVIVRFHRNGTVALYFYGVKSPRFSLKHKVRVPPPAHQSFTQRCIRPHNLPLAPSRLRRNTSMPSSTPSSTKSATKRLLHELHSYESEPNPALVRFGPVSDEDLFEWEAELLGPEDSVYEGVSNPLPNPTTTSLTSPGATFPLHITIPPTYPLNPPILTFLPPSTTNPHAFPIHANIHPRTGAICLDLLSTAWSPAYTLSSTLTVVQQLLTSPEGDSPLDVDVAVLGRNGDEVAVEGLVRLWAFGGGVG